MAGGGGYSAGEEHPVRQPEEKDGCSRKSKSFLKKVCTCTRGDDPDVVSGTDFKVGKSR